MPKGPALSLKDIKPKELAKQFQMRMPAIMRAMAATVQTNRAMLFDKEGAHNGHKKWAPISHRQGRILQDTGRLRRTIVPSARGTGIAGANGVVMVDARIVKLETHVDYAGAHEYGTKHMVARPFMGRAWNKRDQQEVMEVLTTKIQRMLEEILG